MGWLRDLMRLADPPVRSYGALARLALASPNWPADSHPQPRSLAALFSKLDRDQNLDWLTERPEVQKVLAEALGQPVASVTGAARPPVHEVGTGSLLRLDDLPDARPLDLLRESLCPGLPRSVTEPYSWSRDLWFAPGGHGSSMVTRFLEQRGLCQVARVTTLDELYAAFPRRGPLCACFEGDVRDLADFAPADAHLLLITRRLPPNAAHWNVIQSPHPSEYLAQLVEWVAQRLPDDGSFLPREALAWLEAEPLARGLMPDLGSALGLCGLLDELGTQTARGKSLEALARQFFKKRLSESAADQRAPVSWLKRQGIELLVGLAEQLLLDPHRDWSSARSFDEWLDLVPQEHQRGTELDWMRMAFAQSDSTIRPQDLERAAARIPPGAFRIVRALEQPALLRRTSDGRFVLRPRWFGELLSDMARRSLISRSPLEWGELALNPAQTRRTLDELSGLLLDGDLETIEATLEVDADNDPAAVAALEACFLAVGLTMLSGVDFHPEQLAPLWDEQLRLLVEVPGELPHGRVLLPNAEDASDPNSSPRHGLLLLAALAISEQLPRGTAKQHELLRPWLASKAPARLAEVYDCILSLLDDTRERWLPSIVELVDRLRQTLGLVDSVPHPLELPGVVLDEIQHEVLEFQQMQVLVAWTHGWRSLLALAGARGVARGTVMAAIWHAWDGAGRPERGLELFAFEPDVGRELWAHVPKELLTEMLRARCERPPAEPALDFAFQAFGEQQWQAFVEVAKETPAYWFHEEPWRHVPPEVLAEILEQCPRPSRSSPGLEEAWRRQPRAMLHAVKQSFDQNRSNPVWGIVEASPPEHTETLVVWLRQRVAVLDLDEKRLDEVRSWLGRRTRRRDPGWRISFAYLHEIEQGLAPLRRER